MFFILLLFINFIVSAVDKISFPKYNQVFALDKTLINCDENCFNSENNMQDILNNDQENRICSNCFNILHFINNLEKLSKENDFEFMVLLSKGDNNYFYLVIKNQENDILKKYGLQRLELKDNHFTKTGEFLKTNRLDLNHVKSHFFRCSEFDSKYYVLNCIKNSESLVQNRGPENILSRLFISLGIIQFLLFGAQIAKFIYKKSLLAIKF